MRSVSVVEVKAHLSALLAAVEAGEEIAITRRGRVVARLIPDAPRSAADVFRPIWEEGGIELPEPADSPPESVSAWD